MVEAEEIIRIFDLTKDEYDDGVEELNGLGVIDIFRSANAPAGYQRLRIHRDVFVQVAAQVFPGVDTRTELRRLLEVFGSGGGEYVFSTDILQNCSVPLARAQVLIDYLEEHSLIETRVCPANLTRYSFTTGVSFRWGNGFLRVKTHYRCKMSVAQPVKIPALNCRSAIWKSDAENERTLSGGQLGFAILGLMLTLLPNR